MQVERAAGVRIATDLPSVPPEEEVERFIAEAEAERQRQRAQAAVAIWPMHSRRCRRRMEITKHVKRDDLDAQLKECICGWPQAYALAAQEAERRRLAAEQETDE